MATVAPQGPTPTSAEDEALKRNTDCVYFLASPLTCKKGAECEFRHSDYARMNPRDCWYWLNSNCLNPKCPFRHPPLDGLVPPQGGNFAGPPPSVPPGPPVPVPSTTPQGAAKQAVPCIFFQKGYCLKGDLCPFLHGPVPPNGKIQQVPVPAAAASAPVPHTFKKAFGGPEKCTQPKMTFGTNASKVAEAPRHAYAAPKVEAARPTEAVPAVKRYQPPSRVIDEAPKYRETKAPSMDNGNLRSRTSRAHHASSVDDQIFQNGRDADDSLRESSPGFDVLVDDKLREDEYYPSEDQYGRMRDHDRRSLNDFDLGRRDDYNSVADIDPEIHHNRRGYDSYDRLPERYTREQRRSSERSMGEPVHYDRRGPYKAESPDYVPNSDLRHRLSKPRRDNGLKSVVNRDYYPDKRAEDRDYRSSRRDSRRSPARDTLLGSRLQGRIKLPRRSSPVSGGNMYSERENDRGRNRGRSSPSRPQVSSIQGRLRDRLSGRTQDESNEGRSLRGQVMRNDSIEANGAGFAAPKRLSELRGPKQTDFNQPQLKGQPSVSGGKLRDTVLASSLGTEADVRFDGPKPLSEILKRKRGAGIAASTDRLNSDNKEEEKQNENDRNLISSNTNSAADTGKHGAGKEEDQSPAADGDEEEGEISNKKTKIVEAEPITNDEEHPEEDVEEGVVGGEEHEHEHELEHDHDEEYDQGDGEYEYEQDDGEGYDLNEGETADHEDDLMDEDDGDDFAKQLGVSF